MKTKNKNSPKDNILEFIPRRIIEWETGPAGKVFLLKEKSKKKIMKKIIGFFNKSQFFRIHLDQLGTRAWLLADGKLTVMEICSQMKKELGDQIQQEQQRVSKFFILMKKHNFITFE